MPTTPPSGCDALSKRPPLHNTQALGATLNGPGLSVGAITLLPRAVNGDAVRLEMLRFRRHSERNAGHGAEPN